MIDETVAPASDTTDGGEDAFVGTSGDRSAVIRRLDTVDRRRIVGGGAVVATLLVLGAMWTLASPVGSAPDDGFHLASIWCSPTAPADACEDVGGSFAAGKTIVELPAEVGPLAYCYKVNSVTSAECQKFIDRGSTARALANDGIYPGVYYAVLGITVGDEPVNSALLARMLSWTLCLALLCAGWAVLPAEHRHAYLIVLLITAIPHGVFLWASTNPSGLVVAGVSAGWCAILALARAADRREVAAAGGLLVVATIAAAGSRSDGGIYLFIGLVTAAVLVWRPDRRLRERAIGAAIVAAVGLLVSAIVLSRRVDTLGTLLSTVEAPPVPVLDGAPWYNALEIPYFVAGNLGVVATGALDVPMPYGVWVPIVAAFFALVFRGIAQTDRRKSLALAGVLAGLLVVPYLLLLRSGNTVGLVIQPRYVLPLVPVLGYTALHWRRGGSVSGLSGVQLWTVVALPVVAHTIALHITIRRYVTGLDVRSPDLDGGREWWWDVPVTPNMVWAVGSLAFAALAFALGRSIRATAVRPPPRFEPGDERSYA